MRGNNLQNGRWCKSLKTRRLQNYFGKRACCRGWWEFPRTRPGEAADQVHPRKWLGQKLVFNSGEEASWGE